MTVIHPKASLIAEAGPIMIGENNIIEEQTSIIYTSEEKTNIENPVPLTIGVNNVFEVGCEIHAKTIGDHNVFEPKWCNGEHGTQEGYVGQDVVIGNGCIIGAGCRVTVAEKLPDQTVITGRHCVRSVALDRPPCEPQREYLQCRPPLPTNNPPRGATMYCQVEWSKICCFCACAGHGSCWLAPSVSSAVSKRVYSWLLIHSSRIYTGYSQKRCVSRIWATQ
ncbi:Dynactin subunit 6 [Homalodisca vitripennis]|nr:Dynactin subunit 6 [Homalodisca vitripennis]